MLSRRIGLVRFRAALPMLRSNLAIQQRYASQSSDDSYDYVYPNLTDAEDPNMNGGYINPPRVKRQFRDPHANWDDKQERRNFGEPVHEDHDELGMFTVHEYTFAKPGKALFQIGCFVTAVLTLCGVVSITYPEKPSAPREFEGGLETELGGPKTLRARAPGDP